MWYIQERKKESCSVAPHGPTLLICVFGEDSEEWLGTSPHSPYSVCIGPSDYHLFRFVKGNIQGHIMQPMRHSKKLSIFVCKLLRWSSATSVWFSDLLQWQNCICQDRILLRSEAVHRLDWCALFLFILLLDCEIYLCMTFGMVHIFFEFITYCRTQL